MFVKTSRRRLSKYNEITCKPNWTCSGPVNTNDPFQDAGITTDLNFLEDFLKSVKNKGPQDIYLRECACPSLWKDKGYTQMAERITSI